MMSRDVILEVFKQIGARIDISTASALDCYSRDGSSQTELWAKGFGALTLCEKNPEFKESLRAKFPDARIFIEDNRGLIKTTAGRFDVVVMDNDIMLNDPVEHFSLWPDIYRVLKDHAFIVTLVLTEPDKYYKASEKRKALWQKVNVDLMTARADFYGSNKKKLEYKDYAISYRVKNELHGFDTLLQRAYRRNTSLHWLLQEVQRR